MQTTRQSEAKSAELITPYSMARTMPAPPADEVRRNIYIDTIEAECFLASGVVILEGREGVGKSALAEQFARKHEKASISFFFTGASKAELSPDFVLADLGNQARWFLGEASGSGKIDEPTWHVLIHDVIALFKRKRSTLFFIVDGTEHIPSGSLSILDFILDLIPFGRQPIKVLLGGGGVVLAGRLGVRKVLPKSWLLPAFSESETHAFLSSAGATEDHARIFHKICSGLPAKLESVKRLLGSGHNPDILAETLPEQLPNFFDMEWRACVNEKSERATAILAHLCFAARASTVEEIAINLMITPPEVGEWLHGLPFIENVSNRPRFTSEAFRKYAVKKLEGLRLPVLGKISDRLLSDPKAEVEEVSSYLYRSNRTVELLEYLTTERFGELLDKSRSAGAIQGLAKIALKCAEKEGSASRVMRFAMQQSLVREMNFYSDRNAEVDAYLSLGSSDAALALARSAPFKEDRLQLLVCVARRKNESGTAIDPQVLEQIRQLCKELNFKEMKERAWDIAADLLHIDATVALDLVQQITTGEAERPGADLACAQFAFSAEAGKIGSTDIAEKLRGLIKNPKIRNLAQAARIFVKPMTSRQVISEAETITSQKDRIFFLRMWCQENRASADAVDVAVYAIKFAIADSGYTPNARDYRDILIALEGCTDLDRLRNAVDMAIPHVASLEKIGPTEDCIAVRLRLLSCLMALADNSAKDFLRDTQIAIAQIRDLSVKASCQALFAAWAMGNGPAAMPLGLRPENECESLYSLAGELLAGTAEHTDEIKGIIKNIAAENPGLALLICGDLNIQCRRDEAICLVVRKYIEAERIGNNFGDVLDYIGRISIPKYRDDAIMVVLDQIPVWIEAGKDVGAVEPLADRLFALAGDIASPEERCRAACRLKSLSTRLQNKKNWNMPEMLAEAFLNVKCEWMKVEVAYRAASVLADVDGPLASEYLKLAEAHKNNNLIYGSGLAQSYASALQVAGIFLVGCAGTEPDDNDIGKFTSLVNWIPSAGIRSVLWGRIAAELYLNGSDECAKKIVATHVLPGVEAESGYSDPFYIHVVNECGLALYLWNQIYAVNLIRKLPQENADSVFGEIVYSLITKRPGGEPCDEIDFNNTETSWEIILLALAVVDEIGTDYILHTAIKAICEAVLGRQNKHIFDRLKKHEIHRRIKEVIARRLPDQRNIRHGGYVLACLAEVYPLSDLVKYSDWEALKVKAEIIPNLSDKAYVLCSIARCIKGHPALRDKCLESATQVSGQIPSAMDRISRYIMIADVYRPTGLHYFKECLRRAMECSVEREGGHDSQLRDIIDMAYRHDEHFGTELAKAADLGQGGRGTGYKFQRHLKLLKQKSEFSRSGAEISGEFKERIPEFSLMLLRSLNARRITPIADEKLIPLLVHSSHRPLRDSIPSLMLFARNAVIRRSTPMQKQAIKAAFYDLADALELSISIAKSIKGERSALGGYIHKRRSVADAIVVSPGARPQAIAYISAWARERVSDYIIICDPYFTAEELHFLYYLTAFLPDGVRIEVVTGLGHQSKTATAPYDEYYARFWRERISDSAPPAIDICIMGVDPGGIPPIHDRWILTRGGGLRLGTSINSLGLNKTSEISMIESPQASIIEEEVRGYLGGSIRTHNGHRVSRINFSI